MNKTSALLVTPGTRWVIEERRRSSSPVQATYRGEVLRPLNFLWKTNFCRGLSDFARYITSAFFLSTGSKNSQQIKLIIWNNVDRNVENSTIIKIGKWHFSTDLCTWLFSYSTITPLYFEIKSSASCRYFLGLITEIFHNIRRIN